MKERNSVCVTPLENVSRLLQQKGEGGEAGQLAQQLRPFRNDPTLSPCGAFTIL